MVINQIKNWNVYGDKSLAKFREIVWKNKLQIKSKFLTQKKLWITIAISKLCGGQQQNPQLVQVGQSQQPPGECQPRIPVQQSNLHSDLEQHLRSASFRSSPFRKTATCTAESSQ
jgi:hypothetical protein